MKTIGLLGGMSWESTATYYRLINQGIKARLGGHHSAKIVLYSVDFAEIEQLQKDNRWEEAGALLASAAASVERAGADVLVLCTNTMHKVAPTIEMAISIPLLHIADTTADCIQEAKIQTVGLLATRFTMEQDFYIARLRDRGLKVVVPSATDREVVHRVIYDELTHGIVNDGSRAAYLRVIEDLVLQGAQAIVLGCTEIGLLIEPSMVSVPCFDTTELHSRSAVNFSLR